MTFSNPIGVQITDFQHYYQNYFYVYVLVVIFLIFLSLHMDYSYSFIIYSLYHISFLTARV